MSRTRNERGQFRQREDTIERGRTLNRTPTQDHPSEGSLSPPPPSRSPSPRRHDSRSPSPTPLPQFDPAAMAQMDPQQMQVLMMQMMMQNQALMQDNARRDRHRERRDREEREERRRQREVDSHTPAPSKEKTPHVNHPEKFSGIRADRLESFLTRCRQVFLLQPRIYTTETSKVAFMASFLTDIASAAVDPLLKAQFDGEEPPELASVQAFSDYLEAGFGDPDPKGTARTALAELSMTGTAVEYFSNLRKYFAILGWKEHAPIVDRALAGLSDILKDEVVRHPYGFETLNELSAYCIPLDNRLRARRAEKESGRKQNDKSSHGSNPHSNPHSHRSKEHSKPSFSAPSSSLPPPNAVVRTQSSAHVNDSNSFQLRPKLTREELDQREKDGLCRYCGQSGHSFADCRKKIAADKRKAEGYPPKA